MEKALKIFLIILIILMICVYIILLVRIQKRKNMLDEEEFPKDVDEIEYNSVTCVQNKTDYFIVMQCINKFYSKYLTNEEIYNLLDEDYIELFDIKLEEAVERYKTYNNVTVDITDMYVSEIGKGISAYFCYGYTIDKTNNESKKLSILVKIDNKTRTFTILPYEYLEAKGYLDVDETTKLDFEEATDIENKTINEYKFKYVNDEDYANKLLSSYINRCLFNPEIAYEHLDNTYRKKRFGNMRGFQEYLSFKRELYETYDPLNAKKPGDFETEEEFENYLETYEPLEIESYERKQTEEYTQYVVIDNFGNYYIFRETSTMKYSLILDTYTIDIPEFIDRYDNVNVKEKAALNTKKFIDAINEHDYKYGYSCLAEQFKENKFNTIESFEEYVTTNFFERNSFEFIDFYNEGETYIFSVKITDAKKAEEREAILQVIMELGENRSFVMAFNVE